VHLVRNAFDFTDRGVVRIVTRSQPLSKGMISLEIAVSDTGVGISPERLREVFQPLEPADGLRTRRYGVGVGLAISQRLAQALGGELRVQSEIGWGSTFTLSIPVALPEDSAVPEMTPRGLAKSGLTIPPIAERPRSGRILLVDDAPGVRFVIVALLKRLGLEVDAASNAVSGCELVINSLAEGRPYDLILMDLEMPVMTGLEAARRLRQEGWRGPLVALTAHALAGDRERCLAAGCDDYLSKPVTGNDLEQMVNRFVSGETQIMPSANNENSAV
jgi:CheY-like chemotaxis protein